MLLTIDIGNTQTVIGVWQGSDLLHMWRVATNRQSTSDELRMKIAQLFELARIDFSQVKKACIASVVPQLFCAWRGALRDASGIEAIPCTPETAGDLFHTNYPRPHEIGADRVADAVAAMALYGAPAVVVDFGTATNIEVIDKDGCFVGGVIAPGMQTSAQAMFANATKLAATELIAPPAAIGTSTETAIQSGIVLGEADRADGLVRRIFDQLGYEATVIATGGLAPLIAKHSSTIQHVNPELTIEGLRLIGESHQGNLEHHA